MFASLSGFLILSVLKDGWLGLDAHIYYRGSAAWLAGADPWQAGAILSNGDPVHYAALPTTVLILAPFALLPEPLFVALALGSSCLSAVYIIRKLGLGWVWLLFPPLVAGVLSGNPNVVLLACLVSGKPLLGALAAMVKVYVVVPAFGLQRWRTLAWSAALGAVTLAAAPLWVHWASQFGQIAVRLTVESNGGFSGAYFGVPGIILGLAGLAALFRAGQREAIAWLAVPALWPGSELHYSIFALPLVATRPWLGILLAAPVLQGLPVVAPLAVALHASIRHRRESTRSGEHPDAAAHQPVLAAR